MKKKDIIPLTINRAAPNKVKPAVAADGNRDG
jgi:hypothetical protein